MRTYEMKPRGIGVGSGECFICGKKVTGTDFASFVPSKETGMTIVEWLEKTGYQASLDYRPYEPNWIQVKIVGCKEHENHIKSLCEHISRDKKISAKILVDALYTNPSYPV